MSEADKNGLAGGLIFLAVALAVEIAGVFLMYWACVVTGSAFGGFYLIGVAFVGALCWAVTFKLRRAHR